MALSRTLPAARREVREEPPLAPAPHRSSIAPSLAPDAHALRLAWAPSAEGAPQEQISTDQEQTQKEERSNPTVNLLVDALAKCRASLSEEQRQEIARAVDGASKRHGYEPLFVQAMIEVESMCQPTARSRHGAMGLIQVQPATARALAEEAGIRWRGAHTLLDPVLNVRLGVLYLSQLEERFGDLHLAVAAYNLGPNRVESMPRERARRTRYVRKVLARYRDLVAENSLARVRPAHGAIGRIG